MNNKEVLNYFKGLADSEQSFLLLSLNRIKLSSDYSEILKLRGDALDDKRAECPHCQSSSYFKNGRDKGSRKYKCKDCNRGFTEYTGTWINGIHKKHLIPEFMKTLEQQLSLIKSGKQIGIAEGTVFGWRHKFLASLEDDSEDKPFHGITEADETFYLHSQKGTKCTDRVPRSRGGRPTRGISNQEASVLTVLDREGNSTYAFTNMGRMTAQCLEEAIGERIANRTILCSDGHPSFKALIKKKATEHHILIASKGERRKGNFHIQHVNNLHGRMKNFFNYQLRGVSTKYLQKYLNWQKIKDKFKNTTEWIKIVLTISVQKPNALKIFNNIERDYRKIYKTPQI